MREVVNGVMYVLSTGCQWRYIPKGLSPRSTANGYFCQWGYDGTLEKIHYALYVKCREQAEREASPTACVVDSQSVKKAPKKRLSCLSSVVSTSDDPTWVASPQGWRDAPPPSAASALTRRGPCQSGLWSADRVLHAHCHGVFVRTIALRMPRRRRMQATSATFLGRPRSTRLR